MSDRNTYKNSETLGFLTPLTGPPLVPLVPPLPSLDQVLDFVAHRGEAASELELSGMPAGGTDPLPDPPTDDLVSAELPNLLVRVLYSCKNTTVKASS